MTLESRLQDALGANYRIERELGGGGMSRVFVAEEIELGRKVVVKVLPPDMAAGLNAERFRREIQLAASLQHPHIVPLMAAGRTGELVWYTMPLIAGESLRTKLAREGELPISDAVRALRDVADALAYAHGHGVVHRDIKPDNVLLARTGVKVVDFGIAAAVGAREETSDELFGTPAYIAPERFAGRPAAPATDVYALGILLYRCLAGVLPWSIDTITELVRAHRELPPAPLPPIHGLPADVIELCEQSLRKNPDERPASLYAAVVLADAAGLAVTLPPVSVDPTPAYLGGGASASTREFPR